MAHASCAEVESTKSVSEIFSPVTGTVVEVNEALDDAPEQVNADPYGAGWIFVVEMADPAEVDALLDAAALPRAGRGGLMPESRRVWRLVDDLDRGLDAAAHMAADEALLDEVAAGRATGAAAVPLVAAGALARTLPARRRRRPRRVRPPRRRGRPPSDRRPGLLHGADLTYAVAMPRPAGAAGAVDASTGSWPAALIAGLARLGVDGRGRPPRRPGGPGVLRRPAGRRPPGR